MILRQWKEGVAFTQRGERESVDYQTSRLTCLILLLPGVSTGKSRQLKKSSDSVVSIAGVA
jgi:hypothetical protein